MPRTSTVTWRGELNIATVPKPSVTPAVPVPASVDTAPVAIKTTRIEWPEVSATKSLSAFDDRATPRGKLKLAAGPTPFML